MATNERHPKTGQEGNLQFRCCSGPGDNCRRLGPFTLNVVSAPLPQHSSERQVHTCFSLTGTIPGEEPSAHLYPETAELLGPQRNSEGEV